jgi:hypothetical protein
MDFKESAKTTKVKPKGKKKWSRTHTPQQHTTVQLSA